MSFLARWKSPALSEIWEISCFIDRAIHVTTHVLYKYVNLFRQTSSDMKGIQETRVSLTNRALFIGSFNSRLLLYDIRNR